MTHPHQPREPVGEKKPVKILPVADNRKARHDYEILEKFEAGLVLAGSEVKSLRAGQVQFEGAFARLDETGEAWLINLYIAPFKQATGFAAELLHKRARKLLLSRHEIEKIHKKYEIRGLTLIPLKIYFKGPWAKCELGVGRGKTRGDKRATEKNRELTREAQSAMKARKR